MVLFALQPLRGQVRPQVAFVLPKLCCVAALPDVPLPFSDLPGPFLFARKSTCGVCPTLTGSAALSGLSAFTALVTCC